MYFILLTPYGIGLYFAFKYLKRYVKTALNYSAFAFFTSLSFFIHNGVIMACARVFEVQIQTSLMILSYSMILICGVIIPCLLILTLILWIFFCGKAKNINEDN